MDGHERVNTDLATLAGLCLGDDLGTLVLGLEQKWAINYLFNSGMP